MNQYSKGDQVGKLGVKFIRELDPIEYTQIINGREKIKRRRVAVFKCPLCENEFEATINNVKTGRIRSCGEHGGKHLCRECNNEAVYRWYCEEHLSPKLIKQRAKLREKELKRNRKKNARYSKKAALKKKKELKKQLLQHVERTERVIIID